MPSDAERREKALDFLARVLEIPERELPRNVMAAVTAAKAIVDATQPKTPTGALFVPAPAAQEPAGATSDAPGGWDAANPEDEPAKH